MRATSWNRPQAPQLPSHPAEAPAPRSSYRRAMSFRQRWTDRSCFGARPSASRLSMTHTDFVMLRCEHSEPRSTLRPARQPLQCSQRYIGRTRMDLHLKGKKAVVLGGTRGIGRAIAETFAAEGADVAICARNADQVKDTVAALKDKGVRATGASVDIADGPALKSWIEKAGGELGGIDILVSNAGAMAQGPGEADWNLNFRLDVLGAVNAFEAARPSLEKAAAANGDAAFVIISSVSAAESDNASSYGPIKAALIHLAKGLARQHAKRGIRTNVVSPGTVYFKGGVWATVEANA